MIYTENKYYKKKMLYNEIVMYFKFLAEKYKYNLMLGNNFARLVSRKSKIVAEILDEHSISVDNEYIFDNAEDVFDYIKTYIISEDK